MDTTGEVLQVLDDVLGLGGRSAQFTRQTHLVGALPEFDSMAVVGLIGALEERLGFKPCSCRRRTGASDSPCITRRRVPRAAGCSTCTRSPKR
jgi:acyl carrier protein